MSKIVVSARSLFDRSIIRTNIIFAGIFRLFIRQLKENFSVEARLLIKPSKRRRNSSIFSNGLISSKKLRSTVAADFGEKRNFRVKEILYEKEKGGNREKAKSG